MNSSLSVPICNGILSIIKNLFLKLEIGDYFIFSFNFSVNVSKGKKNSGDSGGKVSNVIAATVLGRKGIEFEQPVVITLKLPSKNVCVLYCTYFISVLIFILLIFVFL